MTDVVVREGEVEIKPIKLVVRYDAEKFEIVFQGNTKLFVDGDFHLAASGELGFITRGAPIHLDSVDSQIFLNSRRSKPLQDLPESAAYLAEVRERDERRARALGSGTNNCPDGDCPDGDCPDGDCPDGDCGGKQPVGAELFQQLEGFRKELQLLRQELEDLKDAWSRT